MQKRVDSFDRDALHMRSLNAELGGKVQHYDLEFPKMVAEKRSIEQRTHQVLPILSLWSQRTNSNRPYARVFVRIQFLFPHVLIFEIVSLKGVGFGD